MLVNASRKHTIHALERNKIERAYLEISRVGALLLSTHASGAVILSDNLATSPRVPKQHPEYVAGRQFWNDLDATVPNQCHATFK